ncbi:ATP synthase subunit H-like protein [Sarcoptes scabiei]|uniref:ATP synthase subunit H-like protein n=1 Tax=Sarcoptes scabiei TaxID=52283 RepID=A0A132A028_SARSC|nr:ATP synthase subunit H-like protein [Sarcoptes scabiei]
MYFNWHQWIVPIGISAFWFVIGFVVPIFVPKGPNKGWATTYIAQMNPLFGPQIKNSTLILMKAWGF